MNGPYSISALREDLWRDVPSQPGVYWWFFPEKEIDNLCISDHCELSKNKLRFSANGKACLYHGMAKNLRERFRWHAAQKLSLSALSSGFLSTFRLSLLALNDYKYSCGQKKIDSYFDQLSVGWEEAKSREEARAIEHEEIQGSFLYPLNIMDNNRIEVQGFIAYLKSKRREYKKRNMQGGWSIKNNAVYLVSCVKTKQPSDCPDCQAKELYISDWFKKARQYVEKAGCRWYILSAKYGLVDPDEIVKPYNKTLNTMSRDEKSLWADEIAKELFGKFPPPQCLKIVFLAGKGYRDLLIEALKGERFEISIPMEHLRMGEQLRWLNDRI